jgi:hypothetical protein
MKNGLKRLAGMNTARLAVALAAVIFVLGCGDDQPKRIKAEKKYPGPRPVAEAGEAGEGGGVDPEAGYGPAGGTMDLANAGSITGVFKYKSAAPARTKLSLTKDPWCVANVKHEMLSEEAIVDVNGNVQNAVAYVELGFGKQKFAMPDAHAQLLQKECHYSPHVLTLRAGQQLDIVNADHTNHNYKLTSRRNGSMNETQSKPTTDTKTLNRAELRATFNCDVHPWMLAHVHIFDHDFFTVSGADGAFTLKGVPPGHYKISFIHEKWKAEPKIVDVTAKGTVDLGEIVLQ